MRRITLVLVLTLAACRGPHGGDDDSSGVDANVRPDADNSPDGPMFVESLVYGHSPTELYRIDTNNLDPIDIGPFGLASGSITDIAVNKAGEMYGVSLSHIYTIDVETGHATEVAAFDGSGNLTSLSFVPIDAADPDSDERLVTAGDSGDVYEVNPADGTTSLIGNFGLALGGAQITSSGDIVSVRGYGTLATVDITNNFNDPDYLATIDTTTWAATPIGTLGTDKNKIFGLAFWGGTIFGFVDTGPNSGQLVTIDPVTGTSTATTNQTFRWYGAGVTTIAPIVD